MTRQKEYGFSDSPVFREKLGLLDFLPQEYPTDGVGDFRESALAITDSNGNNAVELTYKSYEISGGTNKLSGLPCVFDSGNAKSQTLKITMSDEVLGITAELYYTVFDDTDAIVRSAKITSNAQNPVYIKKAFSASFDMDNDSYDIITLNGAWGRERHIERHPVHMGIQKTCSTRGVTSHQEHPFMAIVGHNTDWNSGNAYGINLIYSGSFTAQVQRNQFDALRTSIGINPENFSWKLCNGESFETPEAVLVFSEKGLNGMSHAFHDLYRNHIIRSPFKNKMRPVLINNWEATYFNFNQSSLLRIAKEASKAGVELFVLDDGWFGARNDDHAGLGDWVVNTKKLPDGLKGLAEKINGLGMKFGLWVEPEMVNEDSDLFRAHPEWTVRVPGRDHSVGRTQMILDMS